MMKSYANCLNLNKIAGMRRPQMACRVPAFLYVADVSARIIYAAPSGSSSGVHVIACDSISY
jgi:hypothetical protein